MTKAIENNINCSNYLAFDQILFSLFLGCLSVKESHVLIVNRFHGILHSPPEGLGSSPRAYKAEERITVVVMMLEKSVKKLKSPKYFRTSHNKMSPPLFSWTFQ